MEKRIRWLETHLADCSWKQALGIECPGCGMQRAFLELLKGNLVRSFELFPALLPMLALLIFLLLHLIFKFPKGAFILKILFIFTTSILVVGYVMKIANH
jgi:hypothetical protein